MTPRDVATCVAIDILVRPFALNFQELIVLVLNVYTGLIYAPFTSGSSRSRSFSSRSTIGASRCSGLFFLGIFVGVFIVIPPFFAYLYFVQEPKYNDKGELEPEPEA
ncbi:hypothetical protein EDB89DRAFT_2068157 [Lactarius sanguifluus]|nr:hypothetical protein EDB89DRAFT_2068157 [Lactarius sanguifluus]